MSRKEAFAVLQEYLDKHRPVTEEELEAYFAFADDLKKAVVEDEKIIAVLSETDKDGKNNE